MSVPEQAAEQNSAAVQVTEQNSAAVQVTVQSYTAVRAQRRVRAQLRIPSAVAEGNDC